MIVVGLTGGLASGKSQTARVFKDLGAVIFDADLAAKKAVEPGKPAYRAIVQIFGKNFLNKNNQLNRKKLANYVFRNPAALKKLNILIHPGVIFDCLSVIEKNRRKKGVLVLDVPLLFESKMENLADVIVVVTTSSARALKRTKAMGLEPILSKKIVSAQWSLKKKVARADYVIANNGSVKDLKVQVVKLFQKIKSFKNE